MKKLTTAPLLITVTHFKNLLESEGIACRIRNEHLGSIAGEMPLGEIWPELWIVNELDFDRAKQLIDGAAEDESPSRPWRCKRCGEENEGQFAVCWNCGAGYV